MARALSVIPAAASSFTKRSWWVRNARSDRPRASGEYAGIIVIPSCALARPNCVGWRLSTVPPAAGPAPPRPRPATGSSPTYSCVRPRPAGTRYKNAAHSSLDAPSGTAPPAPGPHPPEHTASRLGSAAYRVTRPTPPPHTARSSAETSACRPPAPAPPRLGSADSPSTRKMLLKPGHPYLLSPFGASHQMPPSTSDENRTDHVLQDRTDYVLSTLPLRSLAFLQPDRYSILVQLDL